MRDVYDFEKWLKEFNIDLYKKHIGEVSLGGFYRNQQHVGEVYLGDGDKLSRWCDMKEHIIKNEELIWMMIL